MTSVTVTRTETSSDWTWDTVPSTMTWDGDDKPWTEQGVYTFGVAVGENWATAESKLVQRVLAFSEAWSTSEQAAKTITKSFAEAWATAELYGLPHLLFLNLAESFSFAETGHRDLTLNKHESWATLDAWLRKAHAVLSDLKITNIEIQAADFDNILRYGGLAGWSDFRPFIAGDYNFQKGALRYILKSITDDRARITKMDVVVDVPDIADRGTFTCANTGYTTCNFNRTYTVAPEVQVTLKGGTVIGTPRVTNITKTGFDVRVEIDATTFAADTISWASLGY